jgi:hypothetical protein
LFALVVCALVSLPVLVHRHSLAIVLFCTFSNFIICCQICFGACVSTIRTHFYPSELCETVCTVHCVSWSNLLQTTMWQKWSWDVWIMNCVSFLYARCVPFMCTSLYSPDHAA